MSLVTRLSVRPSIKWFLKWRLLKFGTVGLSGTFINLGVLYMAHDYLFSAILSPEVRLNLSLALAIFIATLNNFLWNRAWTWRDRRNLYWQRSSLIQFGQYALAGWAATSSQFAFTNLLVQFFPYLIANAQAIAICAVINFIVNDRWTFRYRKGVQHSQASESSMTQGIAGVAVDVFPSSNLDWNGKRSNAYEQRQ